MGALALLLTAMFTCSSVAAEQPTFPFLQDSGARSAFISGSFPSCLENQRRFAENAGNSTSLLGGFCLCYGRAIADAVNGAEYEAMLAGQIIDSFAKKAQFASNLCRARMDPSAQRSQKERQTVELKNQCLNEYHPEDTDYSAFVVRDRFCSCFVVEAAMPTATAESLKAAAVSCERKGLPN